MLVRNEYVENWGFYYVVVLNLSYWCCKDVVFGEGY